MKNLIWIAATSIVFILAAGSIFKRCESDKQEKQEINRLLREIERKKDVLDSLKAVHEAFREKRRQDSIRHERERKEFKIRIAGLESQVRSVNLSRATPKQLDSVRIVLHTSDDTTQYCMPMESARSIIADAATKRIQDTIIEVQGSRIINLEETNADLQRDNERNDVIWTAREAAQDGIIRNQAVVIQTYEKRERRKGFMNFLDKVVAVGIGFAVGAFVSR